MSQFVMESVMGAFIDSRFAVSNSLRNRLPESVISRWPLEFGQGPSIALSLNTSIKV